MSLDRCIYRETITTVKVIDIPITSRFPSVWFFGAQVRAEAGVFSGLQVPYLLPLVQQPELLKAYRLGSFCSMGSLKPRQCSRGTPAQGTDVQVETQVLWPVDS